ncbi:MAG: ATP/GTP-binding protein [Crocosphaera sp.]
MLIEFSVGNYRSFKEVVTFSMVAADLTADNNIIHNDNLFTVDDDLKLLKSAAIYGANASGKSNLAKALAFMKRFMINSSREGQSTDDIKVEPFRLSVETDNKPSFFEIVFLLDGIKYRYGFEATRKKIVSEWLFYVPNIEEISLFDREEDKIKSSKEYQANGVEKLTRDNALFLSVSAQFNIKIAEDILNWLTNCLQIISGLNDSSYRSFTIKCLIENENKNEIINFIKKLDLGIDDINVNQIDITEDELPDNLFQAIRQEILKESVVKTTLINTKHRKFDSQNKFISTETFDFTEDESEGTQKAFTLAGPIFDTFKNSRTVIIDEFDARLHPLISRAIIELFNSNETNPNNAQLIVMTHDTNLLSHKLFRRDQIWFTEKDRYGATDLYSLVEYNISDDAAFENDYIKGRYGAIPYIGDLSQLINSDGEK